MSTDLTVYGELNPRVKRVRWVVSPSECVTPEMQKFYERHLSEHPFIEHYERTQDGKAVKLSDFVSQRQFRRHALYNEFYRLIGVDREMAIWLPAPLPLEVAFAVHRPKADFTDCERCLLNLLRPHLIQAYGNAEAFTQLRQEIEHLGPLLQVLEGIERGVIILGRKDGHVRLANARARQWVAEYFHRPIGLTNRLPETLERWLKHQGGLLDIKDDAPLPRKPLVMEREGKRLVMRLCCSDSNQSILLLEQEHTTTQPFTLEPLGLSRREAEVLSWLALGKTNAEIGAILSISLRTVAKHLERIYQKLGVETRTAAALRAVNFVSNSN